MDSLVNLLESNTAKVVCGCYALPGRRDGLPELTNVTSHSFSASCRAWSGLATEIDVKARMAAIVGTENCILCW